MNVARLLIVDDHPVLRQGLRALLDEQPDLEVCGEAGDVPQALQQLAALRPDVAIVDLSLASGHGLDLIKRASADYPDTRIVVFSKHDEMIYGDRALRAGALGYVNKQEPAENLLRAIRHVLKDGIFLAGRPTDRATARLLRPALAKASPYEQLSDREMEVLTLLGDGLSTRDMARQLQLSPKTIESHRNRLKSKLGLTSLNELIRYAVALKLEEGDDSNAEFRRRNAE